jgi:hypothetical protein
MQIPGWQVHANDLMLVPEALCETWPRIDFASPLYRKYLSRIRCYSLSPGRPHDPHDRISRDGFRFLGETGGHGLRPENEPFDPLRPQGGDSTKSTVRRGKSPDLGGVPKELGAQITCPTTNWSPIASLTACDRSVRRGTSWLGRWGPLALQ